MARNDSFNQPWANFPAQFERPGDGLIARGWAGGASEDPPEAKWENWWHNRVDLALQELQNLGQLIWFTDAPYQAGARVNHGGNSYIALSENTGVEPTGTLDIGVWRKEGVGTYLQTINNLSEIAAAGPSAVLAAITNLNLLITVNRANGALQTASNLSEIKAAGAAAMTESLANIGALSTTGTAVAATKLATARTIAGKPFDGTANISIAASDVGALPLTGGTLSGPLTVNGTHDAPLGANGFRSCILTPANGGFTNPAGVGIGLHSNGSIYLWNDVSGGYAMSVSSTAIGTSRPLNVGGTVTPTDYSNFDARYSKFAVGQSWTNVLPSRSSGTWYTNNTGKPIMVAVTTEYGPNAALNCQTGSAGTIVSPRGGGSEYIQHSATFIVMPNDTYRVDASGNIGIWKELR
ncbi:tail collar domain-containing protein [Yersinia pekkanenii]|uniref:Tail collar domain-containing protein n=2 Tax=Yersinia pekkanenii TaxID=1288385 RepID=A0A0T9PR28_9GAMM|nr:hypothetical protein [Yersinia pekkanenii]CNH77610.1 tail collar domain-containing protein [Yersinia pekkanenii]